MAEGISSQETDSSSSASSTPSMSESGRKTRSFVFGKEALKKRIRTLQHFKVRRASLDKATAVVYSPLSSSDAQRLQGLFETVLPAVEMELEEVPNSRSLENYKGPNVATDIRRSSLAARRPGFNVTVKSKM